MISAALGFSAGTAAAIEPAVARTHRALSGPRRHGTAVPLGRGSKHEPLLHPHFFFDLAPQHVQPWMWAASIAPAPASATAPKALAAVMSAAFCDIAECARCEGCDFGAIIRIDHSRVRIKIVRAMAGCGGLSAVFALLCLALAAEAAQLNGWVRGEHAQPHQSVTIRIGLTQRNLEALHETHL